MKAQKPPRRDDGLAAPGDSPPALGYDPEIGPGYFVQTRTDFLRWPGFSPTFKVLYQILCSYAAEGARAWPGQVRLAEECGVSERTIRTVLDELVAAGLLTIKRQGLNKPNLYYIHKLPTLPPTADRQNLPVQSGKIRRSRPAESAGEIHPDQIHPDQIHPPPPTPSAHIPAALAPVVVDQVRADAQLIVERLGIDQESACELAATAVANKRAEGYVADLVAYVTSTTGLDNPAGVLVWLIMENKHRRLGVSGAPQSPRRRAPRDPTGLDPQKYLEGKYAHLFAPPTAQTHLAPEE